MTDRNGRPDHIEDVLVKLHKGQWFGWKSGNKEHKDLIIHHADKSKPTKASLENKLAQAQSDWDWRIVRKTRDGLLRDSDKVMLSDYPIQDPALEAWEHYRQELRNIPQTFSDDVTKVEYPNEPS